LRADENLGFAGANNIGIKFLLNFANIELVWLINNDALPELNALIEMESAAGPTHIPSICGSVLLEYSKPTTIQALGGHYSPYAGTTNHLMAGKSRACLAELPQRESVDFPVGASMLVNRAFISKYGLMSEEYFLYFEEIDWVLRKGWPRRAYAVTKSLVFHKGGAATAAGRDRGNRSLLADYYSLRNRLLLARRVSLGAFLCCVALTPWLVARRLFRKRKGLVWNAMQAVRDGLLGRSGKRR